MFCFLDVVPNNDRGAKGDPSVDLLPQGERYPARAEEDSKEAWDDEISESDGDGRLDEPGHEGFDPLPVWQEQQEV